MGFHEQPLWLKCAFMLLSVGFIVWLSAKNQFFVDSPEHRAYLAFMIIGVLTYYIGLVITFMCTFLDILEGNKLVLLIDAGILFTAAISGLISAGIARTVTHSDRLGWALLCALAAGAFIIICVFGGSSSSRQQHSQQHVQQQQQQPQAAPRMSDWRTADQSDPQSNY